MKSLEKLVGKRFNSLKELKKEIEILTNKTVNIIMESESENFEGCDNIIDVEIDYNIFEIYYLIDNANNYYITEV